MEHQQETSTTLQTSITQVIVFQQEKDKGNTMQQLETRKAKALEVCMRKKNDEARWEETFANTELLRVEFAAEKEMAG